MMLWWHLWRLKQPGPAGQIRAAKKLAKSKDPRALPALIHAVLYDYDWHVRREVARVLHQAGIPLARQILLAALNPEHWPAVAKSREGKRLAESLTLAEWSPFRALRAADALETGDWRPASPGDRAALAVARKHWHEASVEGGAAVGFLAQYEKMDVRDRADALRALAETADPQAAKPLQNYLAGSMTGELTALLAKALGRIGDPEASATLEHLLDSHDARVGHAAVEALLALGTPGAFDALKRAKGRIAWLEPWIGKVLELYRVRGNFEAVASVLRTPPPYEEMERVAAVWLLARFHGDRFVDFLCQIAVKGGNLISATE